MKTLKTIALLGAIVSAFTATSLASISMNGLTYGNGGALGQVFFDTVGTGAAADSTVKVDFLFGSSSGTLDHSSGVFTMVTANGGFLNAGTFAVTSLTAGGSATIFGGQSGFYQMRAWTGGTTFADAANTKKGSSAVTAITFGGANSGNTQTFAPVDLNLHASFAITSAVPEPATIALGIFGAAGLVFRRRK